MGNTESNSTPANDYISRPATSNVGNYSTTTSGNYRGATRGFRGRGGSYRGGNRGGIRIVSSVDDESFGNLRGGTSSDNRGGRGGNRGGRGRNRGIGRGNDGDDSAKLRIPTTELKMPSGKLAQITFPRKPKCFCKKLSDSILLNIQEGGKREEDYHLIVQELNSTIKTHVSGSFRSIKVTSMYKVLNCCLWMRYCQRQREIMKEGCDRNERMLFHGSSCVDDIIKVGFDERHSNQSGMFGAGIYFAEHSSKSNQYVFGYMGGNGCPSHRDPNCTLCERKMLLCRVNLGKCQELLSANKNAHAPPGYHSVAGKPSLMGLLYPEYVIYRGEQAYPEYVITYRIVR